MVLLLYVLCDRVVLCRPKTASLHACMQLLFVGPAWVKLQCLIACWTLETRQPLLDRHTDKPSNRLNQEGFLCVHGCYVPASFLPAA